FLREPTVPIELRRAPVVFRPGSVASLSNMDRYPSGRVIVKEHLLEPLQVNRREDSSVLHLQSQEIEPRRRLGKRGDEIPTGDIVWIWNCVHLIADISRGADIDAEGHRWSG